MKKFLALGLVVSCLALGGCAISVPLWLLMLADNQPGAAPSALTDPLLAIPARSVAGPLPAEATVVAAELDPPADATPSSRDHSLAPD